MAISGVTYQFDVSTDSSLCIVNEFSDEVKDLIRSELTKVCHGSAKAFSGKSVYSYSKTLKEFLRRYNDKTDMTKLGMLGELLCHMLLFSHRGEFNAASPFFNMEEGSIKKGFDLILSQKDKHDLWITEVKSGELGAALKEQKIRALIDKARIDLITRIGSDNATIWHGAINNVQLALSTASSEKELLIEYLENFLEGTATASNVPSSVNVILAPVLFEDINNAVALSIISEKAETLKKNAEFKSFIIFAIQKSTLLKLEQFLTDESGAGN